MNPGNNPKGLIFVATYNECDNVEKLISEINQLNLGFDFLFVDDNSPDKTGEILDRIAAENPHVNVIHRPRKMGIGSAHIDGIHWAYQNHYDILITMDSDFSHTPSYILQLLDHSMDADIVVGSRYMDKTSLSEWNLLRKTLTNLGHIMTRVFLAMPFDATGAFRLYRLDRIPSSCFSIEKSQGYSFFFESLFILHFNHFKIKEISINLPARTYGQSKMKLGDVLFSVYMLWKMIFLNIFHPKLFLINESDQEIVVNRKLNNDHGWDEYWEKQQSANNYFYDRIAEFFRKRIIRPYLNSYVRKTFEKGATLLHAGCGSGQVDVDVTNEYSVIAVDISLNALRKYKQSHLHINKLLHNDIREIDVENESIDGIYSLGVMEHFYEDDILLVLKEFYRILKPKKKVILFWPPENGISVKFLKAWHFILREIFRKKIKMHPDEVSLLHSKHQVEEFAWRTGFDLVDYHFGIKDLFTQAVIVLEKTE